MSSDNLFDKLAELFRSNGPVNWRLAREIAESVAGEHDPVEPWLAEEYRELAMTAGMRLAATSLLDPTPGTTDTRVVDRRTWAGDNVEAFAALAEPVGEKMAASTPLGSPLQPLGPALIGMQIGSVVGFMSHGVLGHFDIGIPIDAPITFVVPNVEEFATGNGLDPRQTRLWVALHETARFAETAVPWVREHALMLVHRFAEGLELNPEEISGRLASLQDPDALANMLDDPSGFSGLLGGEAQVEPLRALRAFAAIMEGYADHLIDRAAAGLIPEAPLIRDAIDTRRSEPSEAEQILQHVLGLDLEHEQYRLGSTFCLEVERRWGTEALDRIWDGPETLPTIDELSDPVGWAARTLL